MEDETGLSTNPCDPRSASARQLNPKAVLPKATADRLTAAIRSRRSRDRRAYKFISNPGSPSSPAVASADFHLCGSGLDWDCVIDGDTIRYDGVKIRIADIDKPEIFSPKSDSELELDQNSKHRLLRLMNAGPFIIVQTGTLDEDVYGRELRVITYDARSVGEKRIAEGLVRRRGWA